MKFDIQFINFPKSSSAREIISQRIKECFNKFSTQATSVKAFFRVDGIEHHVKIAVKAKQMSTCINASATNFGYSIERALQKLESILRRASTKHKKYKKFASNSHEKPETLHNGKRERIKQENVFDKYSEFYSNDFYIYQYN